MKVLASQALGPATATLYAWNNKYLLKFELEGMEQTYKVEQLDLPNADAVLALLSNQDFLQRVAARFQAMANDWDAALQALE